MNFVLNLTEENVERVITFYKDYQMDSKNESVLFFAKTVDVTVTIYTSDKVMFQGEEALREFNMWKEILGYKVETREINETVIDDDSDDDLNSYYLPSIGSDEVGTGDFFGPVVVCAAYISKDTVKLIKRLKIADSKKLSDERIMSLGEKLKDRVVYSLLTLPNEKFNDLTNKGFNLNKIKAYLHNKAILNLHAKINDTPIVIMDQFADEKLYFSYLTDEREVFNIIRFETKAESKFASVAIASIIARYAFLQHFDNLSKDSGYKLLKGASDQVDLLASQIIEEKGEYFLERYAKMNFKNLRKARKLLENK